jgi:ribosomal protein S18 acetylase RimI-like enzyme
MTASGNTTLLDGEIVLRQFVFPQDYPAVIELWQNAGPGIHLRRSDESAEIAKKLERDPDLFIVAERRSSHGGHAAAGDSSSTAADSHATEIVGTVLGGFDGRRGMMYHLAVQVDYRRYGLGSLLMDELERRLRQKGCIRYYLLVTTDNDDAIHFYEKRDWKRMDLYAYAKDLE